MKRFLAVVGLLLASIPAGAVVAQGENLLINGSLDAEQVEFPEFWSPSSAKDVLYRRTGGPEGKRPAIVLRGDGATPGTASARQQGMVLVAGETYKLSAYVKTAGFKSRHAGVVVHNAGWTSDAGFTGLPADSDWTFMEKTFALFPSSDKEYGLAVFAVDLTGELHVADLKLEAVSEAARQGSSSQSALLAAPRLVPIQPLLSRVPRAAPELSFRAFGTLPGGPDAHECLFSLEGDPIPARAVPLAAGRAVASLAGLPVGDYSLKAILRQRQTRETTLAVSFPIRIVDLPAANPAAGTRLNSLVVELLNQPLKDTPEPQAFTVANPRDGWLYVAVAGAAPAPELTVRMDDREPLVTAATDRLEAFRELSMGEHRLTVTGGRGAAARLVVRSIPEIFDYPPCTDSYVKENGSYGWKFMKQHVLPAVTTLNGGSLPGAALAEAKASGLKWLANFNVAPVDDPADVQARMEKHAGLTQPQYDGLTSDELFFGRTTIDHYTKALWSLRNPDDRLVYTWIVGKPSIPSLHTDFMAACLNASRGRGRLLFEAYCHPQPDEKAAAAYLDSMVAETMRRFSAFYPNAVAGTGIIFGNFNQVPIISLEHDPAVDFKAFLDMQVNLVANGKEFEDLATTGYWGTYYGDEELVRWSFLLMRHYAVEGRREMLSQQFGFTYRPGFIHNGDFADALTGWEAVPAAEGAIRAHTVPGYGKNSQGRWGGGNAGDTVCVLARAVDKANRLTQTARGLEVGKAYCLQFVTGDLKDITEKRFNPRRYGIDVELGEAELLPGRGYVHVDQRKGGRYEHNDNVAKINLHRIIFRAKAATVPIAFSDQKAQPGEELVLNYVQLKPYLE